MPSGTPFGWQGESPQCPTVCVLYSREASIDPWKGPGIHIWLCVPSKSKSGNEFIINTMCVFIVLCVYNKHAKSGDDVNEGLKSEEKTWSPIIDYTRAKNYLSEYVVPVAVDLVLSFLS